MRLCSVGVLLPLYLLTPGGTLFLLRTRDERSDKFCLARTNAFAKVQDVELVHCMDLLLNDKVDLRGLWALGPGGVVLGSNGLCLSVESDVENEKFYASVSDVCVIPWNLTKSLCIASGQVEEPPCLGYPTSGTRVPLGWSEEMILFEQVEPNDLIRSVRRKASERVSFMTSRGYQDTKMKIVEMRTDVQYVEELIKEHESLLGSIDTVMTGMSQENEILRPLSGEGALLEYFAVGDTETLASIISPSLSVTEAVLPQLGLSVASPLALKVSGKIVFPMTGNITFRFHDVRGDIKMVIDGLTILETYNTPVQSNVLESDSIAVENTQQSHDYYILSQGVFSTATFHAKIGIAGSDEEVELDQNHLFPDRFNHPVCSPVPVTQFIDCDLTFSEFRFLRNFTDHIPGETAVYCDDSCASQQPSKNAIRGSHACYHMQSSICYAAMDAGILPPLGGVIRISSGEGHRGQFESHIFHGQNTSLGSASDECGWVTLLENRGAPFVLTDVNIFDVTDLVQRFGSDWIATSASTAKLASGKYLVTERLAYAKKSFVDVSLDCSGTEEEEDAASTITTLALGSSGSLKLRHGVQRQIMKYPILGELFLADEELTSMEVQTTNSLIQATQAGMISPRTGWSRQSCTFPENKQLSLYAKYHEQPPEADLPSREVDCDLSFANLFRSLENQLSITVRCPASCESDGTFVSGLFTYTPDSYICMAAQHAGVINVGGGVVKITKLFVNLSFDDNITRNGIASKAVAYSSTQTGRMPNYNVDQARGAWCSYPSKTELELATSVDWQDELPNGALVLNKTFPIITSAFRQLVSFRQEPESAWHEFVVNAELTLSDQQSRINDLRKRFLFTREFLKRLEARFLQIQEDNHDNVNILEDELQALEAPQSNFYLEAQNLLYTDFSSDEFLHRDWSVWDCQKSSLGPSQWTLTSKKKSSTDEVGILSQRSSIFAPNNSGVGTILLFRKYLYNSGFAVFRVRLMGGGMYGTAGFIFGYIDDRNYFRLELIRSATDKNQLFIKFVEFHAGKAYELGSGATCDKVVSDPSNWLMVGIDFGFTSARAFIEGGKCTDGFELIETERQSSQSALMFLGHLGLFSNSLALQTKVDFANIIFGPLSLQLEYGRAAFGDAIAREIRTTAKGQNTLISPTSVQLKDTETRDETSGMKGLIVLGSNGTCYQEYVQKMYDSDFETSWESPVDKEESSWTLGDGLLAGARKGTLNQTILFLRKPFCESKGAIRIESSIQLAQNSIGGIVWRGRSKRDFHAIAMDSTRNVRKSYIQTSLITIGGVAEIVRTVS